MLSRPGPCDNGPSPNGMAGLGVASMALAQRTQRAKLAQRTQQTQQARGSGEGLDSQASTPLAGQSSSSSTISTGMRRGSVGGYGGVEIRCVRAAGCCSGRLRLWAVAYWTDARQGGARAHQRARMRSPAVVQPTLHAVRWLLLA